MIPPATESEIRVMLSSIGVHSIEDLFADIPKQARLNRGLHLPKAMSEPELRRRFAELAGKNHPLDSQISFLGAGVYRHEIPAVVNALISRGEFATAYTPYQAEASQGTLQAIYEFQTLMCKLTGMDVANASHYDGAASLAEASLMALEITQKEKIFISRAVHPQYRQVVKTYLHGRNVPVQEIGMEDGVTSLEAAEAAFSSSPGAALLVQYPNFFGSMENLQKLAGLCLKHHALLVVAVIEPVALGLLKPPGELGAAIVAGEGQSLGIPPSFGGPHVGYIAAKKEYIRRLPGRLVGETLDKKGNRAYTLTLQAREQHIRREKASSNVCTNQSLCAVANAIYLSVLGKQGLKEVSAQCYHKAHYAFKEWTKQGYFTPVFKSRFYHEFVLKSPVPAVSLLEALEKDNIVAGYPLDRDYPELAGSILFTVTEVNRREEIDRFTGKLNSLLAQKNASCTHA